MSIRENVEKILAQLPAHVLLEAAAKTRSAAEIEEAIRAGVRIIGHNRVSELKKTYAEVKLKARWHFIGSVTKQKHDLLRPRVLNMLDMIETVDSCEFARALDSKCAALKRVMDVLLEVNSAAEKNKAGVMPEDVIDVVRCIDSFEHVRLMGLMTMGPAVENPEDARVYFRLTAELFKRIGTMDDLENTQMRYLSMGMSNTYRVAVEEGANIVRIGTAIFGPRACAIR